MASGSGSARRIYLSFYNWVAAYCWAQVLYGAVSALLLESGGHEAVYATVERQLLFAQTAAVVEILHSILGLVRSPVSAPLVQSFERMCVLWGIVWSFPKFPDNVGSSLSAICRHNLIFFLTYMVISWSVTEVIRYPFYGMKETFGFAPSWLQWLRYSTFLVLYPIGLLSEVGLIFVAMPSMKTSGKYCLRMPNKWNVSFDFYYFTASLMPIYVPGFTYVYRYMMARRKKVLSAANTA